jgi:hypothetical protein
MARRVAAPFKIYVPGNHDMALTNVRLSNATILVNEGVEIAGLKL